MHRKRRLPWRLHTNLYMTHTDVKLRACIVLCVFVYYPLQNSKLNKRHVLPLCCFTFLMSSSLCKMVYILTGKGCINTCPCMQSSAFHAPSQTQRNSVQTDTGGNGDDDKSLYTYRDRHTYMHDIHTYIDACMHACMHACISNRLYTHMHTHTHTQTHTQYLHMVRFTASLSLHVFTGLRLCLYG